MKRRMMAPRRLALLLLLLPRSLILLPPVKREKERPRVRPTCIYIYTLGATNFQRRRRWRQHLKLHARQINRPLFRKAKCYSRIVLGETLLLIFKFEDGKVARENGGPRIREERMGRMNEQGGDERERERDVRALGAPSVRRAGLLANNQNGWLIQMESGYT